MKKDAVFCVVFLAVVISGCGVNEADSPITPAPDRPTFLYFYADG